MKRFKTFWYVKMDMQNENGDFPKTFSFSPPELCVLKRNSTKSVHILVSPSFLTNIHPNSSHSVKCFSYNRIIRKCLKTLKLQIFYYEINATANVGSDSSFCTRCKTSKKSASVGMISSELQNNPQRKHFASARLAWG